MLLSSDHSSDVLAFLDGEAASLPDSLTAEAAFPSHTPPKDSVNVFVINERGEALVLVDLSASRSWSSWQVVGCYLPEGEDPMAAVQALLHQQVGCIARQWRYLGTFTPEDSDIVGANHFFFAREVQVIAQSQSGETAVRWVSTEQIRQALLDGRIGQINHATAAALALLHCG